MLANQIRARIKRGTRIVLPYPTILPKVGSNDLAAGKSPEQNCEAARSFFTKVHTTLPDTASSASVSGPVRHSGSSP